MSDTVIPVRRPSRDEATARIRRRNAAERRFRLYGQAALGVAFLFLVVLLGSIVTNGWSGFLQSSFTLPVKLEASVIDPDNTGDLNTLYAADYTKLAREALYDELGVDASKRKERRAANGLLSRGVDVQIRDAVLDDPSIIGKTVTFNLLAHGDVDAVLKGAIDRSLPEKRRQVSDQQLAWIDAMVTKGVLAEHFNWGLFTNGASSQPETAGLLVALVGSFFMMVIVVVLSVPIGVMSAIYLEEFAPRNRVTDFIEVNINNLAAVPSIVYGLFGLGIFINMMGLPRSAALVGGLVLTLRTLPTVIIAARAAIGAVPPSIREAALGVGASKMQTILHHVLPLALPGIMTGTIIGLVQALGETAPLLMIGMVAFITDVPQTPLEPATALPVQIYMWAASAERGFVERTYAATIVLLGFLFIMNAAAVYLRRRFERRW